MFRLVKSRLPVQNGNMHDACKRMRWGPTSWEKEKVINSGLDPSRLVDQFGCVDTIHFEILKIPEYLFLILFYVVVVALIVHLVRFDPIKFLIVRNVIFLF